MGKAKPITIPTHCPLCHKPLSGPVNYVVLANATVACMPCWHLNQEWTIRGMVELAEWSVKLRTFWRSARRNLSLRYHFVDKPRYRKVALRHSGEHPVVKAEVPDHVA